MIIAGRMVIIFQYGTIYLVSFATNHNPIFAFCFKIKMQSTNSIADSGIEYKITQPSPRLSDYGESFWILKNTSDTAHAMVGLPDGRFNIIFFYHKTNLSVRC